MALEENKTIVQDVKKALAIISNYCESKENGVSCLFSQDIGCDNCMLQLVSPNEYKDINVFADDNIRECIYETLKGEQMPKEKLLDIVYGKTNAKKCEISKIVTQMKREKIIYTVKDFEWLGIN